MKVGNEACRSCLVWSFSGLEKTVERNMKGDLCLKNGS